MLNQYALGNPIKSAKRKFDKVCSSVIVFVYSQIKSIPFLALTICELYSFAQFLLVSVWFHLKCNWTSAMQCECIVQSTLGYSCNLHLKLLQGRLESL